MKLFLCMIERLKNTPNTCKKYSKYCIEYLKKKVLGILKNYSECIIQITVFGILPKSG